MNNEYEKPEFEVIFFSTEDVVITSGEDGPNKDDYEPEIDPDK